MTASAPLPPLVLISDVARVGEERFLGALLRGAARGLTMVQVREPGWEDGAVRDLILKARYYLARAGIEEFLIVVNRRPELAAELELAGVHVGGGSIADVQRARQAVGADRLVGYSAHAIEEILDAAEAGANYAYFSPIYTPISKRYHLPPVGIQGLRRACSLSSIPVYALGGVTPAHAEEVRRAGACGAAVIGAVLDATDPAEAVTRFLDAWNGRREEGV